jgi:hypothetical protein
MFVGKAVTIPPFLWSTTTVTSTDASSSLGASRPLIADHDAALHVLDAFGQRWRSGYRRELVA